MPGYDSDVATKKTGRRLLLVAAPILAICLRPSMQEPRARSAPGRRRATSRPGSGCRSTATCATARRPTSTTSSTPGPWCSTTARRRLAIVVCDSCMIPREVVADAKRRIRDRSGLEPDHVLISATHAHSCPTAGAVFQSEPDADYTQFLAVRIADAVGRRPSTTSAPARIGWGVGKNDRAGLQPPLEDEARDDPARPVRPDDRPGQDEPARRQPEPGRARRPDRPRGLGPLGADRREGRPIALLANYSLHYVGGVGPGHASADYFGAFADRVQQLLEADRLDPPFVAMMSNGTSGDINNINFRDAAAAAAALRADPQGRRRAGRGGGPGRRRRSTTATTSRSTRARPS